MQNEEAMCYITYAVPARMMPQLNFGEIPVINVAKEEKKEPLELYPAGFMPDWFLRGSFPEDDFED